MRKFHVRKTTLLPHSMALCGILELRYFHVLLKLVVTSLKEGIETYFLLFFASSSSDTVSLPQHMLNICWVNWYWIKRPLSAFESQLCNLLVVWPSSIYLIFLHFHFLNCKVGKMIFSGFCEPEGWPSPDLTLQVPWSWLPSLQTVNNFCCL